MRRIASTVLFVVWSCAIAYSAGFFVHDVGVRTFGRGTAHIVRADDLSCLYLNPAGLSKIKGTNLKGEFVWGIMNIEYQREEWQDPVYNENPGDPLPFGAISTDFGLEDWTFAFGVYGPYGVGVIYDHDTPQRYAALDVLTLAPHIELAAGWHPLSWLRVGFGILNVWLFRYDHYAYSFLGDNNTEYDIVVYFWGRSYDTFSWTAGVIFQPAEKVEIGFSYIPEFVAKLYGELEAELPPLYAAILGTDTYKDELTMTTVIPQIIRGGVRYIFSDRLDIELDVTWAQWSRQKWFDIDLKHEYAIADFKIPKDNQDTWNFRIGGDYQISEVLTVRTGYYFDQPASKPKNLGPGGVETDRHAVGAGLTLTKWGIDLDLGYIHVFQVPLQIREYEPAGELADGRGDYVSSYDFLGVAVNINFGKFAKAHKGEL